MAETADVGRRYLAASRLPGVTPLFDDFAIGHPITMGIEEPRYHERLREIRESVGVAPVWNIRGLHEAWAITRFDDVASAFLDTRTFSPEATQELHTLPPERLPGLRLVEEPVFLAAAIRGPGSVRVAWDAGG
jgi:hypothetical protein